MNTRAVGKEFEDMAVKFLTDKGLEVITRNFYTKAGEVDIILKDGDYFVFTEVKGRSSDRYGYPSEAVTKNKISRYRRAAKIYLYLNHLPETTYIRFDVISILDGRIEWIKQAF